MNQLSNSFRLSGGQTSSSAGARQTTTQMSSLQRSLQTKITGKAAIQRRLISGNIIQNSRAALVVEGSSILATALDGTTNPSLPRGWDEGVMDDDDGG